MRKAYPGTKEAEKIRKPSEAEEKDEPDFIGNAPNYEKFERWGYDAERTLVWLNID